MRILILSVAVAFSAFGFVAGRLCSPWVAKAGTGSHIVHVHVASGPYSNEARIPVSVAGTPIAISCTEGGQCFVLVEGD
jgi:hypothetical protein